MRQTDVQSYLALLRGVNVGGKNKLAMSALAERLTDLGLEPPDLLGPLKRTDSPYGEPVPREDARDAHWVEPRLVGEVRFSEWTADFRLRHPSWRGIRDDKSPEDVVRES